MMPINIRNLFWGGLFVGILGTVIFFGFLRAVPHWRSTPVSPLAKYQVCDQLSDIGASLTRALWAMTSKKRDLWLHEVMQMQPQEDYLKNLLLTIFSNAGKGHDAERVQRDLRRDCNRKMGIVWQTLE